MTPFEKFAVENAITQYNDWDWRAHLPMQMWWQVVNDGYQGWEMVGNSPAFVLAEFTAPKASRQLAIQYDDVAAGLFYYRDWTSDGLPFVDGSKPYWSGFWFQYKAEAQKFLATVESAVALTANWLPDYEQMCAEMNARRDG